MRIRCDALKARCPLGVKFGVEADRVAPLLTKAKALGLDLAGVSFHVGSGCQEPPVYARAIERARRVFDLAAHMGFAPRLLDIGGGFSGVGGPAFAAVADLINAALERFFPEPEIQVRLHSGVRPGGAASLGRGPRRRTRPFGPKRFGFGVSERGSRRVFVAHFRAGRDANSKGRRTSLPAHRPHL